MSFFFSLSVPIQTEVVEGSSSSAKMKALSESVEDGPDEHVNSGAFKKTSSHSILGCEV